MGGSRHSLLTWKESPHHLNGSTASPEPSWLWVAVWLSASLGAETGYASHNPGTDCGDAEHLPPCLANILSVCPSIAWSQPFGTLSGGWKQLCGGGRHVLPTGHSLHRKCRKLGLHSHPTFLSLSNTGEGKELLAFCVHASLLIAPC